MDAILPVDRVDGLVDLFWLLCFLSFTQARLDASQNESYLTISSLQDEVAQLKAVREEVQKYVRELEQANDDLERAKRLARFKSVVRLFLQLKSIANNNMHT